MRQRLLHIILSPYLLSAFIAVGVIFLLPNYFHKYKIELVSSTVNSGDFRSFYIDINRDGDMERLMARNNSSGNGSYMLYDASGNFTDQFNYTAPFLSRSEVIWNQDTDNNGFSEVYTITANSDSIFLEFNEPLGPDPRLKTKVFVDTLPSSHEKIMSVGAGIPLEVIKNYSGKFVYFSISAGFSGYPRHVYKYDHSNGELIKSSHTTNPTAIQHIINLDDDDELELLLSNTAPENELDPSYTPRSDYSTWLMALDDDLSFMFEPIEFKTKGSLRYRPIKKGDSLRFQVIFKSHKPHILSSEVIEINIEGEISKRKKIESLTSLGSFYDDPTGMIVSDRINGKLVFYDDEFNIVKTFEARGLTKFNRLDVDNNDDAEWIGSNQNNTKHIIYDSNLENGVEFITENTSHGDDNVNIWYQDGSNLVVFRSDFIEYFYHYAPNPIYWFRFLFYLGIYAIVLLIVWVALKGQKLRFEHQQAIQAEISNLQLKTIKNQVDPHFVFNAINTISEMTLMDNKIEADKFISRFSGFMRDTLKHSDRISTTLEEELEYTEKFIQLQQVRYSNRFKYYINVEKGLNTNTLVPKHVLFTYTENAIKHGLALKKNGVLTIEAKQKNGNLLLAVEDNGAGIRISEKPKKDSTGNGLKIMEKIFDLYTQLTQKRIIHKIIELKDNSSNNRGLRIEIEIIKRKRDS